MRSCYTVAKPSIPQLTLCWCITLKDDWVPTLYTPWIRAPTILRLLGKEMIQFKTRIKKGEPDLRKQLKIDTKSTTKLEFSLKFLNLFIYFFLI